MASPVSCVSLSPPEQLLACLFDQTLPEHTLAAIDHRQQLIRAWGIPAGSKVVEIGPGQGDFTVALADAVGLDGRVVAVDPAPLDYGTPDLGTAQAYIAASPLGSRIEFVQADPPTYLQSTFESFNFIVFGHSIWFFSHPTILPRILEAARSRVTTAVLIGEYGLTSSIPSGIPHVLTALTYNTLETFRDDTSLRNIRCGLTPQQITRVVEDAGWVLGKEEFITPGRKQVDGWREVKMLLHTRWFKDDLEAVATKVDEKTKSLLYGLVDAVTTSVARLEGGLEDVRNMDVWIARFNIKAE